MEKVYGAYIAKKEREGDVENEIITETEGASISAAYDRVANQNISYTTSTGKLLSEHGHKKIVGMTVMRTPIQASKLLKYAKVSLATKPYDTLYHLFMMVLLEDGTKLTLEKNENISISMYNGRPGTESSVIARVPKRALSVLLQKTESRMGRNYHRYDAIDNNCQDFLISVLAANNFGAGSKKFIKQDVSDLVGSKTKAALKGVTRVFGIAKTLLD